MSLGENFDSTSLADFSMALESIAIVKCNLSTAHKIDNHHWKETMKNRNWLEEKYIEKKKLHKSYPDLFYLKNNHLYHWTLWTNNCVFPPWK